MSLFLPIITPMIKQNDHVRRIQINRLARDLVVPPGRISSIVNCNRSITADTALRLGKYFGVSAQIWISMQAEYDLRIAQRSHNYACMKWSHRVTD